MSNAAPLASLGIELTANVADFVSDLGRAHRESEKAAKKIQESFEKAGKAAGIALAAGLTIAEEGIRHSIEHFDEIRKSAQKIGVTTEALSGLAYAAKL